MSDKKTILSLVPSGPIRSEPFDFKGQTVRWRLLDSLEVIACNDAATRVVAKDIGAAYDVDIAQALELVHTINLGESWRMWLEYYTVAAAMTDTDGDPIAAGSP